MERVLNGDEKVRRAEEIYYRRKMGLPAGARGLEPEKKSYLGSKIFLEILIILNISIIVVAVQNKDLKINQAISPICLLYYYKSISLLPDLEEVIDCLEREQKIPMEYHT